MKAMILAAGIGSRLRPLTDDCPKALIDISGTTMLELTVRRLMSAGADQIIVNVFHKAEQIEAFLKSKKNFGIRIELSKETQLLDTGGGLNKASRFFDDDRPFFLHNVDAFTDLDLGELYRRHGEQKVLGTLAVSSRKTDRYLLFDEQGLLRGRENIKEGRVEWSQAPLAAPTRLAFNGVHVISPRIFALMTETGVFSITQTYLRLAGLGEKIQAFRMDGFYWRDIGSPEKLEEVRRYAAENGLSRLS